jgi:hypothetical protein
MAKKRKLISKKTKKKLKAAAPWAIAIVATGGMIAAVADRSLRGTVRSFAAGAVEKVHPKKYESTKANGMVNGIVPQESGAV